MPLVTMPDLENVSQWRTDFIQAGAETEQNLYTFALDNETPDANQIITALSNFAEQYGANPIMRQFVESIMPRNMGNNDLPAQYNAVASFVLNNLTYMADPNGVEYVISPLILIGKILENGTAYGDCDDHVLLFNSMLNSIGFETHVVAVKADVLQPDLFTHVLSLVKLAGQNYFFDACNKENPYEVPTGDLLIA